MDDKPRAEDYAIREDLGIDPEELEKQRKLELLYWAFNIGPRDMFPDIPRKD